MLKVTDGKVIDGSVTVKLQSKIEHGPLAGVRSLIMHQTGGKDAKGARASYQTSPYGAYFLIDCDATIYQTTRVTALFFGHLPDS